MFLIEEVFAMDTFAEEDVTKIFSGAFRKMALGRGEFWHVSADDLIGAVHEQVDYHLNRMLVEVAEELVS